MADKQRKQFIYNYTLSRDEWARAVNGWSQKHHTDDIMAQALRATFDTLDSFGQLDGGVAPDIFYNALIAASPYAADLARRIGNDNPVDAFFMYALRVNNRVPSVAAYALDKFQRESPLFFLANDIELPLWGPDGWKAQLVLYEEKLPIAFVDTLHDFFDGQTNEEINIKKPIYYSSQGLFDALRPVEKHNEDHFGKHFDRWVMAIDAANPSKRKAANTLLTRYAGNKKRMVLQITAALAATIAVYCYGFHQGRAAAVSDGQTIKPKAMMPAP